MRVATRFDSGRHVVNKRHEQIADPKAAPKTAGQQKLVKDRRGRREKIARDYRGRNEHKGGMGDRRCLSRGQGDQQYLLRSSERDWQGIGYHHLSLSDGASNSVKSWTQVPEGIEQNHRTEREHTDVRIAEMSCS